MSAELTLCGTSTSRTALNLKQEASVERGFSSCDHEEADTRMILHLADAVNKGVHNIFLRAVDTDVVVLSVAAAAKIDIQELWVAFGTSKNFRYIPVHKN